MCLMVQSAQGSICVNWEVADLEVEIRSIKTVWHFQVIEGLSVSCIVGVDSMRYKGI